MYICSCVFLFLCVCVCPCVRACVRVREVSAVVFCFLKKIRMCGWELGIHEEPILNIRRYLHISILIVFFHALTETVKSFRDVRWRK